MKKQINQYELPESNNKSDKDDRYRIVQSARDLLLLELNSSVMSIQKTIEDISEEEYHWEPLPPLEQSSDLLLPPDKKRVWRVFQEDGVWHYDYTPEELSPPPFTTIAWIMNHVAQAADMYLYCIKTGQAEGVERRWEDLPIPPCYEEMSEYILKVLDDVKYYLISLPQREITNQLNKLTPAPWGEMRPTYMNIWGGVIKHVIQHTMQIAARKDRIRYGH